MINIINVNGKTSNFRVTLREGVVRIRMYYSASLERFLMDVENISTGEKSIGIVVNTGMDLLHSSGRIGLAALVLISAPTGELEGELINYNGNLSLAYMDMATYNKYYLGGNASVREVWPQPDPEALVQ